MKLSLFKLPLLAGCCVVVLLLFATCSSPEVEYTAAPAVADMKRAPLRSEVAESMAPAPEAEPGNRATDASFGGGDTVEGPRSRVYSASLELQVLRVDEARDKVRDRVLAADGRVEGLYPDGIVARVPAKSFLPLIEDIEALGTLLNKTIDALDVSDRISDLQTRLELAEEARERLYLLLERAEDTDERLAVLREIRRLSETIESYRRSIAAVQSRVAYSRIHVAFRSSTEASREKAEEIPFPWMRTLDPFAVSVTGLKKAISLDLGPDYAIFRDPPRGHAFYAESAGGSVVRLGSVRNEPQGDGEFWQKSMLHYLGPLFAEVIPLEFPGARRLYGVRCKIPGNPGYLYEVFTVPQGGELYIVEGVFPENDEPALIETFHDTVKREMP